METTVKQRLIVFLKYKRLSQRRFELAVGLSNGFVNNIYKGIGAEKVKDLESDSTRRFCPYCVSDSVYEQIDSAIKSNKERWHY